MRYITNRLVVMVVVLGAIMLAFSSCSDEGIEPRKEITYLVTYEVVSHLHGNANFSIEYNDPAYANISSIYRDSVTKWSTTCEMKTLYLAYLKASTLADSAHFQVRILVDSVLSSRDSLYVPPIGVTDTITIQTSYLMP